MDQIKLSLFSHRVILLFFFLFFFLFNYSSVLMLCAFWYQLPSVHLAEVECSFGNRHSVCSIANSVSVRDGDILTVAPVKNPELVRGFRLEAPSYLKSIPAAIFMSFPNLRTVILEAAGIDHLSSDKFFYARNLNSLVLNSNSIRRINAAVFSTAPYMAFLVLSDNILEEIEDNAFYGMSQLEELRLERNKLRALRRFTFSGAENLQILDVQTNEIELIEDGALDLPMLTQLHLGRNKIKILPGDLCGTWNGALNLEMLNLEYNHIRYVRGPLRNCAKLNDVHLDNNPIRDVNVTAIAHANGEWIDILNKASFSNKEQVK